MAKRPNSPEDENPEAGSDEEAGATAFVRIDGPGHRPAPPSAVAPATGAPRKGLQVQLPDEEPPPPPKKPKVAVPPAKAKGRRGAWWDEKSAGLGDDEEPPQEPPAEPPADDEPGGTAMMKIETRPPPQRRRAPAPAAEPAAESPAGDGRTQFFRPDQVVLQAEVRQRPAPVEVEPGLPWKHILFALAIAIAVTLLGVVVLFRRELFDRPGAHPTRPAAADTDKAGE